jgi:hypothetical protein
MKKLILIITMAFSTIVDAQEKDYTFELSAFQGMNTRMGMFDGQLTFDNGFFINAGIYGLNHFYPDWKGTKADDFANLFIGTSHHPTTFAPLSDLVWEIGVGITVDGMGETWYQPSIRTMDLAFRNVLRYPVRLTDKWIVSADLGNQIAIGSPENTKYEVNNLWFVGLTGTWRVK